MLDLELVNGGNPMFERAKENKWYITGGVGALLVVSTLAGLIIWHCKKPKHDWYDENPKEKLFVIEVIDNHRPVTMDQIATEYGIEKTRAEHLLNRYGGQI